MAIKVRSSWDNEEYLLLGSGYTLPTGAAQASSGLLLGTPSRGDAPAEMVMVCNREGSILWFRSQDLEVISIDGKSPKDCF